MPRCRSKARCSWWVTLMPRSVRLLLRAARRLVWTCTSITWTNSVIAPLEPARKSCRSPRTCSTATEASCSVIRSVTCGAFLKHVEDLTPTEIEQRGISDRPQRRGGRESRSDAERLEDIRAAISRCIPCRHTSCSCLSAHLDQQLRGRSTSGPIHGLRLSTRRARIDV